MQKKTAIDMRQMGAGEVLHTLEPVNATDKVRQKSAMGYRAAELFKGPWMQRFYGYRKRHFDAVIYEVLTDPCVQLHFQVLMLYSRFLTGPWMQRFYGDRKRHFNAVEMPVRRFHKAHGQNIRLLQGNTVAHREVSFAHALVFSEKPLQPGEIFLVEIEKTERGWSGHMRIGLTEVDPAKQENGLPQYALPDLGQFGRCWVSAVTKSRNRLQYHQSPERAHSSLKAAYTSVLGNSEVISTSCGRVRRSMLQPSYSLFRSAFMNGSNDQASFDGDEPSLKAAKKLILATDVGSRIGVMYCPDETGYYARMHFIINGEDQGPSDDRIPLSDGCASLFAVVDVYGTTKQIRLIELYKVSSLQNACRDLILQTTPPDQLSALPLPQKVIHFLCEGDNS